MYIVQASIFKFSIADFRFPIVHRQN